MSERAPDPVDLMLDGDFEGAARAYLALYIDALRRGDAAIGPDLLTGLRYCVAGITKHEPTDEQVTAAVNERLTTHGVRIDRVVADQLQIAGSMVAKARKRAQRSVAGVESEKERRWEDQRDE